LRHSLRTVRRAEPWARHLGEERCLAKASVAAKLNAVCGMYKFAAMDGYISVNPAAHVRRPKIEFVSTSNGLSRPQLADMLKAAEAESPMTYSLICLLALNGLRIGECLASNVEELGFERGYRTLHLPHRKGGKVGTLALAVRTAWALERSMDGRTSGPLLLGRDGITRLKVGFDVGPLGVQHVDTVEDAPVAPLSDRDRVPGAGALRVAGEETADDELQGVGGDCHRERTLLSHGLDLSSRLGSRCPLTLTRRRAPLSVIESGGKISAGCHKVVDGPDR
jgi:hypothetical protein